MLDEQHCYKITKSQILLGVSHITSNNNPLKLGKLDNQSLRELKDMCSKPPPSNNRDDFSDKFNENDDCPRPAQYTIGNEEQYYKQKSFG